MLNAACWIVQAAPGLMPGRIAQGRDAVAQDTHDCHEGLADISGEALRASIFRRKFNC